MVRRPPREPDEVEWNPSTGRVDGSGLAPAQAVVHLAGESLAGGLWTVERKRRIRESRIAGTQLLVGALLEGSPRPPTLVSASAIGYYGNRGDDVLTEDSGPGTGFLAELAVAWERATDPAADAGIRVVRLRSGLVLSPAGGVLRRLLLPFRLGLGAVLGSGRQWMSWVMLEDAIRAITTVLATPELAGPINLVAPHPASNEEFTRELGDALKRPTLLRVPASLLELLPGDLAREALLASLRVVPARLQAAGFTFAHPILGPALRAQLRDRA